ncbi:MAG: hypothetical protein A2682_01390 [Candidatus Terrybacteria bacterium RIFCSPHIGHO2_01_FULL_58_15]|uniref:Uncharacterized protein n=1 Tax=Terrybacteria sp. (strain RIFCSPHIGHO2_01_FULL_58_15) TaxID=1802363 RepID=A0A1G2PNC4_TERXR|nr:MAG: hypothetical protein A2682_01390 [Candidatus Terrybacteria bacterium RIFCSPHIGHO2_01_FULL_58_15]
MQRIEDAVEKSVSEAERAWCPARTGSAEPDVGPFQRRTASLTLASPTQHVRRYVLGPSSAKLRDIPQTGPGGTSEAESRAASASLGRETASFLGRVRG